MLPAVVFYSSLIGAFNGFEDTLLFARDSLLRQ